jgi:hypothetical protein
MLFLPFPHEIVVHILSFLDLVDLLKCRQVRALPCYKTNLNASSSYLSYAVWCKASSIRRQFCSTRWLSPQETWWTET